MARRPLHRILAICALALLAVTGLSACGKEKHPGEEVREGLSTPLGGLRYTVFITRQLNLADPLDRGYVPDAEEAEAGKALYGVFLEACNTDDEEATAVDADAFHITDTQENEFEPIELEENNPYAYKGGMVPAKNCEPRRGSLAQQGPASGAVLLFELPLEATENRPLKLHIDGPAGGEAEEAVVILDV